MLLAVIGIAALVLVAVLGGLAQPVEGRARPGCAEAGTRCLEREVASAREAAGLGLPLAQTRAAAHGELSAAARDVSALQLHRPGGLARGRGGFSPDPQAIQRAVRDRHDAIVAAMGQRIRSSAVPAADGHAADRPTIVTRPLRGPPSHG